MVRPGVPIARMLTQCPFEIDRNHQNSKDFKPHPIFPMYNIQVSMSVNGTQGLISSNPLQHFHIPTPVPFKITPIPLRSIPKYDRDGHWNQKQRLKYSIFLSYFHQLFSDPSFRKNIKLYEMMSDMIITRNPNQCRSHHQKMEKYRTTIKDIISSVAERYEPRLYEEQSQKYLINIKNILENQGKYIRTTSANEEVKYFYTTFVSKKETARRDKKGGRQGKEVKQVERVEVVEDKNKEDRIRTTDSYLNVQLYQDDDAVVQHIPVMNPLDHKLEEEEEEEEEEIYQSNGNQNDELQPHIHPLPEIPLISQPVCNYVPASSSLHLSPQSRLYYQQQIKLVQMKREWHCHNTQQLSTQLRSEEQSIRHCDMTIQLYQSALGSNSS